MRRVFRHLFTIGSFVSLALGATVGVLWAIDRHGTTSREVEVTWDGNTICGTYLYDGNVFCGIFCNAHRPFKLGVSFRTDHSYSTGLYCYVIVHEQPRVWHHLGGFGATGYNQKMPGAEMFRSAHIVMIPAWLAVLVLAIPSSFQLVKATQRSRRPRTNACSSCGYALGATLKRCPECGTLAKN